jgi:hypothetical protein
MDTDSHAKNVGVFNAFTRGETMPTKRALWMILVVPALFGFDYHASAALTHYWAFEAGSGATAVDSVGGNNGTLVNSPVWSTDVPGNGSTYSLSFNATSSQRVDLASAILLDDNSATASARNL